MELGVNLNPDPKSTPELELEPQFSFSELANSALEANDLMLYHHLFNDIEFISYSEDHILKLYWEPTLESQNRKLHRSIEDLAYKTFAVKIQVERTERSHQKLTIAQQQNLNTEKLYQDLKQTPIVEEILKDFPGSKILKIKPTPQ